MAHTNQTTNYHMSQFLGTDKPAWLTDYNTDMSTIDGQMKTNADNIVLANNLAQTAKATADQAEKDATDALADAATAQQTANGASADAGSALLKATALEEALNLVGGTPITSGIVSVGSVSATVSDCRVTVAKNSVGSLCKIYGYINIASTSSEGTCTLKITNDSGLRPESDFEVEGVCFKASSSGIAQAKLAFKTTGEIDCTFTKIANTAQDIRLLACLIFVKSFGD